jgi:hypothetical protein
MDLACLLVFYGWWAELVLIVYLSFLGFFSLFSLLLVTFSSDRLQVYVVVLNQQIYVKVLYLSSSSVDTNLYSGCIHWCFVSIFCSVYHDFQIELLGTVHFFVFRKVPFLFLPTSQEFFRIFVYPKFVSHLFW